jgi:homoserine O-acetyltransferase
MERVMDLTTMNLYTPAYYASSQNADNMESYMENIYKQQKMKPEDYLAGLRAIVRQNLFVAQDGSVNDLNKIIKAKILLIAAEQDHMANPIGSITLSKELDAPLLVLESNCGHIAVFCEAKKIRKVVMDFL